MAFIFGYTPVSRMITTAEAQRLVSEGLDGVPLSEGEQAFYYAGASGLSVTEAAELNSYLDVDPERAISAWQKGAKIKDGKPKIKVDSSAIEDVVIKNEVKRQADSVPGAKAGIKTGAKTVSYTPENKKGPEAISGAKELKDENYRVAAEKYRTEENGKEFDLAYSLGLTGEEITGLELTNISDDARIAAYFAGRHDASALAEKRRTFEGRSPGVSRDGVTAAILSRYSKRTREIIDTIGKKLGVEIRLSNKGEDSLYNYAEGVVTIAVNEKHKNLKGDKLIRFIVTHEAIHRIMETSPKTYKEMEKIALSKSETTVEEKMAEYECSREDAIEEIVADYFGDLLSSKEEIRALMNEHRNVFDVIYEAIEWLFNKLRGTGVAFTEIAEARKLFKEALSEADSNVWGKEVRSEGEAVRSENVKWSLSKNAERDVKAALDNVSVGGDIQLTNSTPSIMLGHKDVNNFPLWMKASHIRENIFTEAEAKAKGLKINKNTNYHGLGDKLFLRIIDSLDDVTLAYRGTKNAENPDRRENYFLLITEMKDGEGNVVNVPVYINESRKINKNFVKVNLVATAYGKKNLEDYIKRELNKGNLVRIKKRSIQSSEAASPINADYRMDASKDNIPQKSGVVNTYSMQEDENYADIKRSKSDKGKDKGLTNDKKTDYNGNGEQFRVMWTLEEGILDRSEVARVYEAMGEVKRGTEFPETPAGEYILDLYDKIAIVGGSYNYPEVARVITFDIEDSYLRAIAMEEVIQYGMETTESDIWLPIIEAMYGQGNVAIRDYRDSKAFSREIGRRNGITGQRNSRGAGSGGDVKRSKSTTEDTDVKYFPPGEKPRRAIDVPSEIDGEKVRRFARTAAEAPAVSDEIAEDVVSAVENGRFFYEQSSNATLIAAAETLIEDGRAERIWSAVTEGKKVATDLDIAVGEALLRKASNEGDSRTAMKLISEIAIEGTRAGKVVQAMKLLKRGGVKSALLFLN